MQCDRCGHRVLPLAGHCKVCGRTSRFWRHVTGWTLLAAALTKLLMVVLRA
jgi:uncharacterized OB-fold protein